MASSLSRASSREGSVMGGLLGSASANGLLGLLKAGRGGSEEEEDDGGEGVFRSRSKVGTLFAVSGGPEGLGTVCEGESRSIDGLGDLWSRTVFTEVREGVVTVLDGLGLQRTWR